MNYRGAQFRLTAVLGELSDVRDLVWNAQRATIGTHRPDLLTHLERTGESLESAYDDVTRARLSLLRAEQDEGGDDE